MLHAPTLDAPFGKAHHGPAPTGGGPPSVPSAAACASDGQASAVASPWGVRGGTFFAVPGAAAAPDSDGGVGVALGASAGASVASGGLGDRWSMCGSGTSIGGSSGYSSDEEDELSTCGVADAAQDRWEAAWGDHHAITSEHGDGTDSPGARRCPPANSDARDCAWTLAWDAVLDRPLYSNSVTFQVQWHHPFPVRHAAATVARAVDVVVLVPVVALGPAMSLTLCHCACTHSRGVATSGWGVA